MEYDYQKLKEVGKVSHDALEYSKSIVKVGAKVYDVCDKIEEFIKAKKMDSAFPVNISVNENAAHYTATINDQTVFTKNDLVKVDLGARSGNVLGDCAMSIDLSGKYSKLIETAEESLQAALSKVRAGVSVNEIGREVERVCKSKGFNPIKNLGGHLIEEDELHGGVFIPNFDNGDTTKLEEGQVVAVETFVTDRGGFVVDSDTVQIFQKNGEANLRSEDTRKVSAHIDSHYKTYPFAIRWLSKELDSEFKIRKALNELSGLGILESFPMLVEKNKGIVAQAEQELIVEKDSCTIVTA